MAGLPEAAGSSLVSAEVPTVLDSKTVLLNAAGFDLSIDLP
jgi:hypothetical protein